VSVYPGDEWAKATQEVAKLISKILDSQPKALQEKDWERRERLLQALEDGVDAVAEWFRQQADPEAARQIEMFDKAARSLAE
jgi:hypothetical protein